MGEGPEQERNVDFIKEVTAEPVRIVLRIVLESGVSLFFDDATGCAYGNDGKTYFPVCREVDEELEILGWSCETSAETVLTANEK